MIESDIPVDFAQLWTEEQQLLAEIAASVPENGTIVEIGTAQGGSSLILHRATSNKKVKIYSFDIAPSSEAYEHLKDTSVTIVAKSSTEGACTWMETAGKPVDLLFIDGGHTLQQVFEDFNSWVPLLKPGGRIMFHDYDPIERGGLAHLGVQVCLDATLRAHLLDQPIHQYRMLYGIVSQPNETRLDSKACYQAFADLGYRIATFRDCDYSEWVVVGSEQFTKLVRCCLKIDDATITISPDQVTDPKHKYLVSARPFNTALDLLQRRGIPKDSIVVIDSLKTCYIIANALEKKRDHLLKLTSSHREFLHWEELLFMFEHAFGTSQFPDIIPDSSVESDISKLSQIVAREQVRLAILSNILKTFVDWIP